MAQPVTFPTAAATLPVSKKHPGDCRVGMSQRAAAYVRRMAAERAEKRAAAEREQQRLEAECHATFLNRARTAQYLGISIDKLRRMITAGTIPAPIKGEHKQSPPRWHIDHLREFKAKMQGG